VVNDNNSHQLPDAEAADNRRRWFLTTIIGICVVVAASGIIYLASPKQETVPDVRGRKLAQATQQLQSSHLHVGNTTAREDTAREPDVVISQYPPSGERVRSGTAVDLIIAKPSSLIEVPTVTGQPLEAARQTLSQHKLAVGNVERQPRADVAPDIVLEEHPGPGQTVASGTKIDLVVSDLVPSAAPSSGNAANERSAARQAQTKQNTNATNTAASTTKAKNPPVSSAALGKATGKTDTAVKAAATPTTTAPPRVTIRSASCTTIKPGEYKIDLAGDAYAASPDPYLFFVWVAVGNNGTRWRPVCKSWSVLQPNEDPLWDVTCVHRRGDPSQTNWQTSRIITSKNGQPPNNGGTSIFKMGTHSGSNLKFVLTCK